MRVAVIKWGSSDGIAEALCHELTALGHEALGFRFDEPIPLLADVVLTFAPYGRLLQIPLQLLGLSMAERPLFVHWSMESLPNPSMPWPVTARIAAFRSWVDRLNDSDERWAGLLLALPPLVLVNRRLQKYRFLGDYRYYYRQGWLDLLIETSELQAAVHRRHGVPAAFVPWGTSPEWRSDLGLGRDLDVFWMGKPRTRRRARLLKELRRAFGARGVTFYVADGFENPLVYGDARTELLNRSKITLNLLPTWYDTNFAFRFHMAAGNRSLVVSEPTLPHCSRYQAGIHFVSTPTEKLVETVLHYLEDEDERRPITDAAYELVVEVMTLRSSVSMILQEVERLHQPQG